MGYESPKKCHVKNKSDLFSFAFEREGEKETKRKVFRFLVHSANAHSWCGAGGVRNRAPEFLHPSAMLPSGSREAGLLVEQVEAEAGTLVWDRAS